MLEMSENKDESLSSATRIVIELHPPLTRKGKGPPLILVAAQAPTQPRPTLSSLQKWAEEGFAVVQIQASSFESSVGVDAVLKKALAGLDECPSCDGGNAGLIGRLDHHASINGDYLYILIE